MAAVPSIGRASRIDGGVAPEADATRALYEEYANQVFRYCLHQLGSREEAEDAVQSTFLNAFRGIKRGVVPELESAWLFKIAHNVCLSRRRSAWRRGRVESPADFEVIEDLTPAPARRADELIGLQDVLEQLPETQRKAILLREWQGLSYREIAAELELSQAAVETLIFRARRSLAHGLEQPAVSQKRAARALDWGNVLAGLKAALLGGSVAAKVAATIAVVSASTVVATAPMQFHQRHQVAPVPKTPVPKTQAPKVHASRGPIPARAAAPDHHAVVAVTPRTAVAPTRAHVGRRVLHRSAPVHSPSRAAPAPTSAPAEAPPVQPAAAPAAPAPVEQAPVEQVVQPHAPSDGASARAQVARLPGDDGSSESHGRGSAQGKGLGGWAAARASPCRSSLRS